MKVRKVSRPFSQIPRAMPSVRQHVNFFLSGFGVKITAVVVHVMSDYVHPGVWRLLGTKVACAVTTEKMSRVPTENEFFGSHVVNGEYDAGASVSSRKWSNSKRPGFPVLFVVTRDDDMPLVVREGDFHRFEMIREISWRTRFPGDAC